MKWRQGRLLLIAPLTVLGVFALGGSAGATPFVTSVPSTQALNGIACESHTDCWSAGDDSSAGFVLQVSDGTPGTPTDISGSYAIYSVACPSATQCYAVGTDDAPNSPPQDAKGFIVPITSDAIGTAVTLPGTDLYSIACKGTSCVGVGDAYDSSTGNRAGAVVPIDNGVAGTVTLVPAATYLLGAACTSAKNCLAVGTDQPGGVVVPVTKGVPGTPQTVAGLGGLDSVGCQSSSTCAAVGGDSVLPISSGTAGTPTTVSGVSNFFGIQCRSTGCQAVGENSTPTGVVVPVVGGTPGAATTISGTDYLNGVDCPTSTECIGAGADTTPEGAVATDLTDQAAPTITSLKVTGAASDPTITVKGTGFGKTPPAAYPSSCGDTGSNFDTNGAGQTLFFTDTTAGWGAGASGDCIGLVITKWTTNTIEFQLGSGYSDPMFGYTEVAPGDQFNIVVQGVTLGGTMKSV